MIAIHYVNHLSLTRIPGSAGANPSGLKMERNGQVATLPQDRHQTNTLTHILRVNLASPIHLVCMNGGNPHSHGAERALRGLAGN